MNYLDTLYAVMEKRAASGLPTSANKTETLNSRRNYNAPTAVSSGDPSSAQRFNQASKSPIARPPKANATRYGTPTAKEINQYRIRALTTPVVGTPTVDALLKLQNTAFGKLKEQK